MQIRIVPDNVRYAGMKAEELRRSFLIEGLFAPGRIDCVYCDVDRAVIGSAVPTTTPLTLPTYEALRSVTFLQRRELGVLNIGGPGHLIVDGAEFPMGNRDCLYIGQCVRDVTFYSADPDNPAKYYLLSYPAHAPMMTALARQGHIDAVELGATASANRRTIYKCIHPTGIPSCQLVMGFTQLQEGSVWNTMPPHTHLRRSEVYLYFDLAPEARVLHLMGTPDETRHLFVANEQVVISPPWSIHAGAGTGHYAFCWGMGGENQEFTDMDPAPVEGLR